MPDAVTDLAELVESWEIALRAAHKSEKTIKTYLKNVRVYTRWCREHDRAPELTRNQVREWMAAEIAAGLAASTVASHLTALKSLTRWAALEDELPVDEVASIPVPATGKRLRPPLSAEEVIALIGACSKAGGFTGRRDEALIRLMVEAGGRASEIVGIACSEISIPKGTVLLHGKGDKDRLVAFGPRTQQALDRYNRLRRRHALAGTDRFWLGSRNRGFGYYALWNQMKLRARQAGIVDVHPHRFRRTFADRWLEAGGTVEGLRAMAGWSDMQMIALYAGARANIRALDESRRLNIGDL